MIILSFIIVNYNLAQEIENCLKSLLKNVVDISFEVIIVDNNSTDRKLFFTKELFNQQNIHFYFLEKNVGFGQGCNFGFSKASGKYICFLNPDTLIISPIFKSIINLFESDHSIGIIGPKQYLKRKVFDLSAGFSPNVIFEFLNIVWIGTYIEAFIVYLTVKFKKEKNINVGWVLGAALFIRAPLFKKVNGFDKDYFMFYEEVDLCSKISANGHKIVYSPKFSIYHIGSVSGKKDYSLFTQRIYTSKYIYISKHFNAVMRFFMRRIIDLQIFSQIILWIFLFPVSKQKSKEKLDGFFALIKTKFGNNKASTRI